MALELRLMKQPSRRTQAARSAETRAALLDAAIQQLNTHGYAGATLALIAEAAGVSRGSILHQFGTRTALMVEVVSSVFEAERRQYARMIEETPSRGSKASDWPRMVWSVLSQPAAIAVQEILQGSRSDPELAEQLRPIQNEIETVSYSGTSALIGEDEAHSAVLARVVVALARGLAIQSLTNHPDQIEAAIDLVTNLLKLGEEHGLLATRQTA